MQEYISISFITVVEILKNWSLEMLAVSIWGFSTKSLL